MKPQILKQSLATLFIILGVLGLSFAANLLYDKPSYSAMEAFFHDALYLAVYLGGALLVIKVWKTK